MTMTGESQTVSTSAAAPAEEVAERSAASALNNEALVSLKDITFTYPTGLEAIKGLSLEIPRGSVTAIVGPSGCGKSTLLRLVAGLLTPTSGTVEHDFAKQPHRHPVSMVFQEDTLLPWLTARNNAAIFHKFHPGRVSNDQLRARIDELFVLVGLENFGDAYPKQLSGGMRRRLAFLAGVAPDPQLLLLDEPFSSVDEPTRVQIHEEVRRIIEASEMTTLLVTHDLAEAISLADRVVIISARPTTVYTIQEAQLDRSQDMLGLRNTPEYVAAYANLWEALSLQIRKSTANSGPAMPRTNVRRWRRP